MQPEPDVSKTVPSLADPLLGSLVSALRAERERQGISRWTLACKIGVSEYTLKELEAGRSKNPAWSTVAAYAKGLGVEVRWAIVPNGGSDGEE